MEILADILLIAGALGTASYCIILSRRLKRFTDLEKGVGGAIAVLSAQVDDMTNALQKAQGAAMGSSETLQALTHRAENASRRLEVLVAAMHDLPDIENVRAQPKSSPADQAAKPSLFRSHRTWAADAETVQT